MAKDPNPPTSIRLPPDAEAELVAIMKQHGDKKRGTAIILLLRLGMQAHRDMPKYEVRAGQAPEPSGKIGQLKPHDGKDGVHIGPVASKPGERLKQTARGKSKWAL